MVTGFAFSGGNITAPFPSGAEPTPGAEGDEVAAGGSGEELGVAAGVAELEAAGAVVVWEKATTGKQRQSARMRFFIALSSKSKIKFKSARIKADCGKYFVDQ